MSSEDKKESFENISKALNTEYEQDEKTFENKIQKFEDKKDKLVAQASGALTLEDAEYMKFELKSLIQGGLRILEKLDEDIKIGSKVRSHEVYFSGVNSIRDTLRELRELNRTIVDIKLEEKKVNNNQGGPENVTINNFLDGKQLLNALEDAKKNSSMNEIKAEFKIEDNKNSAPVNYRNGNVEKDRKKKEKENHEI